jgi:ABC-type antimicrobial peptide transport system permease subunit
MHTLLLTLQTALRSLRRNVFRSALTCLGIIIAVAAVIAMVEIGKGSNSEVQKRISSWGAAILMIFPNAANRSGVSQGAGTAVSLTPQDCNYIMLECPAVKEAAPVEYTRGQAVYGSQNWAPGSIQGTTPYYFDIHQWQFAAGNPFTDADVANEKEVCVIGQTVAQNLFGDESPIGKEIRLKNVLFKVVGLLSPKGANVFGGDQDDIILAPWTTIKFRVEGNGGTSGGQGNVAAAAVSTTGRLATFPDTTTQIYPAAAANASLDTPMLIRFANVDSLIVSARSMADIPEATNQITSLLRDRHNLGPNQDDDFVIRDLTEIGNMVASTGRLMTQLLLVVALISLVVGGVGIMNIMLVSVTERTREIGLRMAVGARGRDILRQFLIEAVVLCLIGGIVGLAGGRFCSMAINAFMHWPTEPSAAAAIAALGVSAGVGILFGFYPAWKASRLDPIEALRYE